MANVIANRSNRFGIPFIEAQSVSSDGTNTTVAINNHVNINRNFIGYFTMKFPEVVATSTEPLFLSTIGVPNSSTPVYLKTGAQATVADIASTAENTYHTFFYDCVASKLQLQD